MLLKANKYRKDKKADCRQNELGSRIFVGRVFVDYTKCLHFYPSFSYGRIIAGESDGNQTEYPPGVFGIILNMQLALKGYHQRIFYKKSESV